MHSFRGGMKCECTGLKGGYFMQAKMCYSTVVWWMTTNMTKSLLNQPFSQGCAQRSKPMDLYAGLCKLRK